MLLETVAISVPQPAGKDRRAFSFDSVWFYRDGTRVIPEISKRWLTVVFDPRDNSTANDFESTSTPMTVLSREKAKAIINSHDRLIEYLYDPNLAEDACFFRMRDGLKLEDISHLINQLSQDEPSNTSTRLWSLTIKPSHFSMYLSWNGKQELTRHSGSRCSARPMWQSMKTIKENRYAVDVTAIPFFRALNLLAEDIKSAQGNTLSG